MAQAAHHNNEHISKPCTDVLATLLKIHTSTSHAFRPSISTSYSIAPERLRNTVESVEKPSFTFKVPFDDRFQFSITHFCDPVVMRRPGKLLLADGLGIKRDNDGFPIQRTNQVLEFRDPFVPLIAN